MQPLSANAWIQNSLFCICSLLLVIFSVNVIAQTIENDQSADSKQVNDEGQPVSNIAGIVSARDWRYMLAGSRLKMRESVDGSQREESLDFCSNGVFYNRLLTTDIRHNDVASSFGMSTKQVSGMWIVTEVDGANQLLLRKRDSEERRMLIEDRNGETYLDGKRYYMLENRRCR